MARDFLFWRHLRVVRARSMRHVHRVFGGLCRRLLPGLADRPARTVYGVRMWPHWDDRTYAYCHYGTYGPYLADLIASIEEPFCFLDVGANQGLFSLIAARNPVCEKIVALEPVPATHARLAANLALAKLEGRAEALPVALSDRSGEARIMVRARHSGAATLGDHLGHEQADALTVRLASVDELAAHLPDHLPLFVKIDVEGHEPVVIEELLASGLARRILGIFYEHDERWTDSATIARALYRAGFARLMRYGRGRHCDVLAGPSPVPLEPIPAFECRIAEGRRAAAPIPDQPFVA